MLLLSIPIVHFLPGQSGYKRGRGWGKKVCLSIYFSNTCTGSSHSIVSVFYSDAVSIISIFSVGLVVITEMAGYAIAPGAMNLSTFLWAGLGTGLCSSSANAFNQVCIFDCKCLKKKKIFFSSV